MAPHRQAFLSPAIKTKAWQERHVALWLTCSIFWMIYCHHRKHFNCFSPSFRLHEKVSYCHHLIRAWWRSWISYSNDQVCGLQDSHISGVFFLHSLQLFTYALYMHFFFTGIGPLVCQVYWKNVWRNLWPQKCRAMCNSLEKPPPFLYILPPRSKTKDKGQKKKSQKKLSAAAQHFLKVISK